MTEIVLLDAGPLGMVSHPWPKGEIVAWLATLVTAGVQVLVPEIADYELRRELLRAGKKEGIERLDELKASLGFLPITSEAMLQAAAFWAEVRRRGRPTAGAESLDADVILAAQAATLTGKTVVVASTNTKHLSRFVSADRWQNITV